MDIIEYVDILSGGNLLAIKVANMEIIYSSVSSSP